MKQLCFFLLLASLYACQEKKPKGEVVVLDGHEIPIEACEQVHRNMLGKAVDTKQFCKCLLPGFYEAVKKDPVKLASFLKNPAESMTKADRDSMLQVYQQCFAQSATTDTTSRLVITPNMARGIKKMAALNFKEAGMEDSVDVNRYCDCMIAGFQAEFTAAEFIKQGMDTTDKFIMLQTKCLESAKKE